MEFLTKNEYYGILSLKKQYVNKDYDINNELIAQYSELSLRKRNELINNGYFIQLCTINCTGLSE